MYQLNGRMQVILTSKVLGPYLTYLTAIIGCSVITTPAAFVFEVMAVTTIIDGEESVLSFQAFCSSIHYRFRCKVRFKTFVQVLLASFCYNSLIK